MRIIITSVAEGNNPSRFSYREYYLSYRAVMAKKSPLANLVVLGLAAHVAGGYAVTLLEFAAEIRQ